MSVRHPKPVRPNAGSPDGRPRTASFSRRLGALLYEALLLAAMALIGGFALLPLASPGAAAQRDLAVPPLFVRTMMFCLLVAGAALYYTWSWSEGRRTLPQKTWRMRLVNTAGEPVDRKTALTRYAAALLGPLAALAAYALLRPGEHPGYALWLVALPYAWAFFDRDRQFLHDRLVGTRLVSDG